MSHQRLAARLTRRVDQQEERREPEAGKDDRHELRPADGATARLERDHDDRDQREPDPAAVRRGAGRR